MCVSVFVSFVFLFPVFVYCIVIVFIFRKIDRERERAKGKWKRGDRGSIRGGNNAVLGGFKIENCIQTLGCFFARRGSCLVSPAWLQENKTPLF